MKRKFHVSVLLTNPPHPYSTNPRLDVIAEATDEIYDLVARRYPSGVVMGIWDRGPACQHRLLDEPDGSPCTSQEHPTNPGGHTYESPGCPVTTDRHETSEAAAEGTRG